MFRLPKEIKDELQKYKGSLLELLQGKSSDARFKGIRVPWGIYSHRGGKVYMTRIRIPGGIVTAEQLKALAEAAKKWGNGVLHVTTRQDIQIHEVAIADTIKIMEFLEGYDLSPRGGGGNTVRNVTACALSGICPDEIFEVHRDAVALTEYLIRQESSFNLPRKFKVAFSGCATDCAGTLVNDVGLLAQPGGYKVFVGGGMGAESALGQLLEEKLPPADVGYSVQAVKNIFYAKGDRRNRHRNRLRFLIKDLGFAEFKKLYQQEFQNLKETEYIALRKVDFTAQKENPGVVPAVDEPGYKSFLQYSVRPQKQQGFSVVELRLPQADITAEKLSQVAELGNYEFRASQNQNLFMAWVPNQDLFHIFQKIKAISTDFLFPQTLLDVTACKGALTCNLGVCNSPGLARSLEEMVRANFVGKKVFAKLEIKVNGCPNACGQQPLGKISLYGLIRRVDNRAVPFYKFFLGGRKAGELTKLAEPVGMLPARNVPAFLKDFLARIEAEISEATEIYSFLAERGKQLALELLEKYAFVPSFAENKEFYIDWGRTEEFSLAGLGPGECGAGVIDMIEADLHEAQVALDAGDTRRGLFLAARALLVVKGIDPRDEREAFKSFKTKFIEEGIAAKDYNRIGEVYETHGPGARDYARDFLGHVGGIYKSMDPFFNFPGKNTTAQVEAKETVHFMDLKGTPCPINYVKVKLFLENLASGSLLDVLLDEGEPIKNVPKSLQNDGHQILKMDKDGEIYRVRVRKK